MSTESTESSLQSDSKLGGPRLLQRVHEAIRVRHYSRRTEEAYVHWIKRLIYFHGKRHPETMGEAEVTAFLNHLAVARHVAAATQNQALSAILFLYRQVLGREWHWQYIFPSQHRSADPEDGVVRRHHLYDSVPQRAIKEAASVAGIA